MGGGPPPSLWTDQRAERRLATGSTRDDPHEARNESELSHHHRALCPISVSRPPSRRTSFPSLPQRALPLTHSHHRSPVITSHPTTLCARPRSPLARFAIHRSHHQTNRPSLRSELPLLTLPGSDGLKTHTESRSEYTLDLTHVRTCTEFQTARARVSNIDRQNRSICHRYRSINFVAKRLESFFFFSLPSFNY